MQEFESINYLFQKKTKHTYSFMKKLVYHKRSLHDCLLQRQTKPLTLIDYSAHFVSALGKVKDKVDFDATKKNM